MKKLMIGLAATAIMASSVSAAVMKFTGQITYVQVRPDGKIAVKVLPNGGTTEVYHAIGDSNPDKAKALYAMALTALSTGKDVEAWTNSAADLWDTFFLRK